MMKQTLCLSALALALSGTFAQKVFPVCYKQDPGIVVDGVLSPDDWKDIKPVILLDSKHGFREVNRRFQWKNDADLSGFVKLAYRNDCFYLGCSVKDDIHHQKCTGVNCWRGDHVELIIDFAPASDPERTSFGKKQFQLILSPGSLDGKIKPEGYMMRPDKRPLKAKISAAKTADGYQLEAEIPWSEFGFKKSAPSRQLIGVDVMISDTDAKEDIQEKLLFAGKKPFALKRGRLLTAYLSDSKGTVPENVTVSGKTVLSAKPVTLDKEKHELALTLDYQPEEGLTPVLRFHAYGCSSKWSFAGYSPMIKVLVNGKVLHADRLFNKNSKAVLKDGKQFLFVKSAGQIVLPYIKDLKRYAPGKREWPVFRDPQDWLTFDFNLSGMLKPGKNTIVFDNNIFAQAKECRTAVITDAVFFQSSLKSRNKRPAPAGTIPVITPKPVQKVPFELKKISDSKMEIRLNGEKYEIGSRWTVPEGKFVTGDNRYFSRKREILREKELVVVRDTIVNKTKDDLPVMHFHEVKANPEAEFFLNGYHVAKTMKEFQWSVNGSTFVQGAKSGVGLFPGDDVTRIHGENYVASKEKAGLADRKLVIPAGKSITTEIYVIPVDQPDYFTFINALRRKMGVNFTIQGSCCEAMNWWYAYHYWLHGKDRKKIVDALRAMIRYTASRYVLTFGKFTGAHSTIMGYGDPAKSQHPSFYDKSNRATYLKLLSYLQEAAPEAHTYVYYHCFIDTWPESMKLFKKDAIINAYGAHQHYMSVHTDKNVSMLYLPTLENDYGKACNKMIDEVLKYHCPKNAAFYCDEFNSSKIAYSYNPNIWDNCSGEIDGKTFKLKRRMTSVTLASEEFRLAMLRKVKAAGREVVVNAMPNTRRLIREQPVAFMETARIDNCNRGHIYTPVQLGDHLAGSEELKNPETIYHQMLDGLDYGCLYYYYYFYYVPDHYTLTEHMFPLTPVELHKGYIIGEEKIVTKVSGLYGWNDNSAMTAFVYDDKGWPVRDFKAPVVTKNGKQFMELRLPEDWSAVILRNQGKK